MKYVYVVDKDEDIRHIRISLSDKDEDGAITIQIEDKEDPDYPWALASLQSDGTLMLHSSLPDNLGLQLDDAGCVKTVKE